MKKTIALILAVVLLCGCAAGCSSSEEDTVMTVNGIDVSFDEYMIWLGSAVSEIKEIYSSYSGTEVDWDGNFLFDDSITNTEWCIKRANETVTKLHTAESKAAERGVTVSDEQKQDIEDELKDLKKNYATGDDPDAAFEEFLASYNYTEASYKAQRSLNYLYYNLFTEISSTRKRCSSMRKRTTISPPHISC